jgi:hypothetical protein
VLLKNCLSENSLNKNELPIINLKAAIIRDTGT